MNRHPVATARKRALRWAGRLGLVLAGLMIGLIVLELGIRLVTAVEGVPSVSPIDRTDNAQSAPLLLACDCPWIYELNLANPEVNSLGLRGQEITLNELDDVYRVVVLGDSVAYGSHVPLESTFVSLLSQQMNQVAAGVQVLNVSVPSWTAYNEVRSYLDHWRQVDPDLVIVVLVLNDIVNPRRHWPQPVGAYYWQNLPPDAIPNQVYDQELVARYGKASRSSLWDRSALFRTVAAQATTSLRTIRFHRFVHGKLWEVNLTGEDTISIDAWLNYDSPEWQWLRGQYNNLRAALDEDGTKLAIVIVPLSYQLDEAYPYYPQQQILRYCSEAGLNCLDTLPVIRENQTPSPFLDQDQPVRDIWHLSEHGHSVVADAVYQFIREQGLLAEHP